MSNDYTFISDLNNGAGMNMNPAGMPMQGGGMPMQGGGMPMQGGGMPMQDGGMPIPGPGPDQFDMLRKYLADSAEDPDSDSDSDSDDEDNENGNGSWQHYYGIVSLIMLAIIFFYVFKIRKELTGMYEEA